MDTEVAPRAWHRRTFGVAVGRSWWKSTKSNSKSMELGGLPEISRIPTVNHRRLRNTYPRENFEPPPRPPPRQAAQATDLEKFARALHRLPRRLKDVFNKKHGICGLVLELREEDRDAVGGHERHRDSPHAVINVDAVPSFNFVKKYTDDLMKLSNEERNEIEDKLKRHVMPLMPLKRGFRVLEIHAERERERERESARVRS